MRVYMSYRPASKKFKMATTTTTTTTTTTSIILLGVFITRKSTTEADYHLTTAPPPPPRPPRLLTMLMWIPWRPGRLTWLYITCCFGIQILLDHVINTCNSSRNSMVSNLYNAWLLTQLCAIVLSKWSCNENIFELINKDL